MWNTIITLSSVGFGDIYPKTLLGRLVGVIICFWGVFIISFFVVSITNILLFTSAEQKAYAQLIKLFYKSQLKKQAVNVLSTGFKYKTKKINKMDPKSIESAFHDFRMNLLQFKNVSHLLKKLNFGNTDDEFTISILEDLVDKVNRLKTATEISNNHIKSIK